MENLTKKEKKEKLEQYKRDNLLRVFNAKEDLYKWIQIFVGWKLVVGWVDKESNSSPIDAIWEVYRAVRDNTGDVTPGFILLSSRSSYKTLSVSVLEVLLMLHFRTSIAHMAAIKPQSQKAISYITSLLRKLKPYLDYHKWEAVSESVSMIKYETPEGESPYIKVVVCTMAGANCIAGNSIVHKSDGTQKMAIDIEVGEKILTWDYINQKDVEVDVGGIGVTEKQAFEILFNDGSNLVCSDDHPIFSQCGWRFAETLRVGTLTKRKDSCPIKTIAPISTEVVDHDLEQPIYGTVGTRKQMNNRFYRKVKKEIIKHLDNGVKEIKPLGKLSLVDIHIKTDNPNLRSFYANNTLVHNSDHTNIMCFDEIDVVSNPAALEEAKMIPDVENGRFPITVKLSTRKFAFGLMNNEIEKAPITGDKILRWNLMDTAERCDEKRHKPELPKQTLYVARNLPLETLTEEQFSKIDTLKHSDFQKIEAWAGCYDCKLLPVCKTGLSKREKECTGSFYKPISSILNSFKKVTPDVAEAQLLCWRPSTKGLVYPRFDEMSNSISVVDAYNQIADTKYANVSFDMLVGLIKQMDYPVYCSVDWGSTNASAFIIGVKIPNGDFWILDCYAQTELELDDLVAKGIELKETYNVLKFYVDQAYPAYIKTFQKNGLRCPKFTKDVMGGIQITRGQVCDSVGRRRMKIVQTKNNKAMINMFKTHHFLLNAQGELTDNPDNEKEVADLADSLRYMCQNLFAPKGCGGLIAKDQVAKPEDNDIEEKGKSLHQNQFQQEVKTLKSDSQDVETTRKSKGGLFWSM